LVFPEVRFEKLVISVRSPESERGDLLEQPHKLQCRILWRVTSEEMDVVFIRFYLHDLEAFLVCNARHELLDLFAETNKELFAIFANEDDVLIIRLLLWF
jgi:succinate dehydrogenase flavin-adding protein (antitoxin of CptAB toxin-antitoxin module)